MDSSTQNKGEQGIKLVVLGANGRTGAHVVRRALEQGVDVTSVVRSSAMEPIYQHDRLNAVIEDPCDPRLLAQVLRGQDAVISTLGGRSPTKHSTSVYIRTADALVETARKTGLTKVVVTSSDRLFRPGDSSTGSCLSSCPMSFIAPPRWSKPCSEPILM